MFHSPDLSGPAARQVLIIYRLLPSDFGAEFHSAASGIEMLISQDYDTHTIEMRERRGSSRNVSSSHTKLSSTTISFFSLYVASLAHTHTPQMGLRLVTHGCFYGVSLICCEVKSVIWLLQLPIHYLTINILDLVKDIR